MNPKWSEVTWYDATSRDGWTSLAGALDTKPSLCKTVGEIIRKNKDYLVVAATRDLANEGYAAVWSIPMKWVVKIRKLK